jgi:NitT/TauT family transport system permease protein
MSGNNAKGRLRLYQLVVLAASFLLWYALTSPTLLPAIYFDDANQAAFFFGEPQKVRQYL